MLIARIDNCSKKSVRLYVHDHKSGCKSRIGTKQCFKKKLILEQVFRIQNLIIKYFVLGGICYPDSGRNKLKGVEDVLGFHNRKIHT